MKTAGIYLGFLKKEFSQTLRDPVMKIFIFIMPVIQLTLFGFAISTEVKNIKLAVIYMPNDSLARQLTEKFYVSDSWFIPIKHNGQSPESMLRCGYADAVIVMPKNGLTKTFGRNESKIQLLIDSSNTVRARAIENYVNVIINKFLSQKIPDMQNNSISFDIRVLYNPTMKTSVFMVPGIMTMIICIITVMLTAMSIAKEKEIGTLETIIAAPLSNKEIILGKTMPFILLGMLNALIVISAGIIIFNVPMRGSFLLALFTSFIFVCNTVSIGTLISTFAKNQQQAMMGSFLFIFPANLMSGIMFPIDNMPQSIKIFAYLNPLKYYVDILRDILLKGANIDIVYFNLGILILMMIVIVNIAVYHFKQTLN